jgi:hypothetical protein
VTAAAEERCELTELVVNQCGCRVHRGGQTPQEEVDTEQRRARARLLGRLGVPGWFAAQYAGTCSTCDQRFLVGAAIRLRGKFDRPALNDSNWIAECCVEETKW